LASDAGYTLAGEFRYVRIGAEQPADNVGIVALSARRDWEDPATIRLFARLVSAAPDPLTVALALLVDGAEVQRAAIELPPTPLQPSAPGESVGEAAATFA